MFESYDGKGWEGLWREQEKGKGREILHLIWRIVFVEDGRKILTSNVFSGLRVLQRDENGLKIYSKSFKVLIQYNF